MDHENRKYWQQPKHGQECREVQEESIFLKWADRHEKIRNNAGKTTPAATAPMANAYANATVLEKIENLAATFRHRKCNETSS
ncbi:hypothetical protein F2Q69_00041072 [Brassica cretica]|uniref:Uncharacterized protein n=1 Tax=Brassica cretica TaxID=69181 RepID=A0A8S9ND20_BRACR|nr:hypothetical protein F2Q69_00041072 [Brassica cretica]